MGDEDLSRVAAVVEAGEPLDAATARALVGELQRLRDIIREHLVVTIRPITPQGTDPSQAWFWTPEWQAGEREADADIAAGRVRSFDNIDALFAHLDRE